MAEQTDFVLPDNRLAEISPELAEDLRDRLNDAEQLWRYFCRRDEMNAEIHLDGSTANVRYSPITVASERVAAYLAKLFYGHKVDYVTSLVSVDGGADLRMRHLVVHNPPDEG